MANFDKLLSQMTLTVLNTFSEKILIGNRLFDGIYEHGFFDAYDTDSMQSIVTIREDEAVSVNQNEVLTARNMTFIVSRIQSDGSGFARLFLEKQ